MRKLLSLCLALAALLNVCAVAEPGGHYNWYEVFVRSYQDSDGDGLGDLRGLTGRLPYIADMGFDGLWLMPVMPSPSYHKYDVTDYRDVDPEYGTLADMQALVQEAHALGISVIVDLPVNHTSTAHPWFREAARALRAGEASPYTDYYHFSEKPQSGYVPLSGTNWYYEEQFAGGGMPDLNLDSAAVREEISGIAAFWLREIGADGFRLDAVTSYYTGDHAANIAFLRWLKETCEAVKPGSYLVGECWSGLNTIAQYYESGVDSFFLFPASQAEGFVISSLRGRSRHAEKFAKAYENVLAQIPDGVLAPFLCNHDTGRTLGSVQGRHNLPIAKFAEGLLSVMNGCAFVYYGDEIGMVGSGDDPNKRLAMYWSEAEGAMTLQPPGVTSLEYAYPPLDVQAEDEGSLYAYVREAFRIRKSLPLIAEGKNTVLLADGDMLLMERRRGDESLLIAVNFSASQANACAVGTDMRLLNDLETGAEAAALAEGSLRLPPYGIAILAPSTAEEGEGVK